MGDENVTKYLEVDGLCTHLPSTVQAKASLLHIKELVTIIMGIGKVQSAKSVGLVALQIDSVEHVNKIYCF